MKRFMLGSAFALACSVGLAAQTATVKSESKVDVKNGKEVTVTGCLARSASGTAYLLNNVEGKDVTSKSYILVGDDLDSHIGHFIEIKGKASNIGDDGKVEVTTKTKVEREDGDDTVTKSKAEIEGPAAPAYLGVRSVKMLRASCR